MSLGSLKDRKENFKMNLKFRLINPAKSEIAIVSKEYIDIIKQLLEKKTTNVNQWRNTDAVVTWFQNIENKDICSFIKFDIVDFYPSISKDIITNAISFAKSSYLRRNYQNYITCGQIIIIQLK